MRGQKSTFFELHLALDTEEADFEILKKYGMVKDGITRDIIVSTDMTLHALHYAIQSAFGWQNTHQHQFQFPDELFDKLTNNHFLTWTDYCGVYFRFPDYDIDDKGWDDDYEGNTSIKAWLRKKYTAPYRNYDISENLMEARLALEGFIRENKSIKMIPAFAEWSEESEEERDEDKGKTIRIRDATCDEVKACLEGDLHELLERLKLSELLTFNPQREDLEKLVNEADRRYAENYNSFSLNSQYSDGYEYTYRSKMNKINCEALPLTDELFYIYDFGDFWEVKIKLTNIYFCDIVEEDEKPTKGKQKYLSLTPCYNDGTAIEGVLCEKIKTAVRSRRPVCVAADGMSVLDDVGGINGYSGMLQSIYADNEIDAKFISAKEAKEWASSLGWKAASIDIEKMF